MNTTTFPPAARTTTVAQNFHGTPSTYTATEEPPAAQPPPPVLPPPQTTPRFLKGVGIAAVSFGALLFSVFREIEHNSELYHMGQLVAASDTREREWQERYRLEKAHDAILEAIIQGQEFPAGSIQVIKAGYHLPN